MVAPTSEVEAWEKLYLIEHHTTGIFPDDTSLTCTLTALDTANTFSAWAEVEDNTSGTTLKLSAAFASYEGHITSMVVESLSEINTIYLVELAYGDSKVPVLHLRFMENDKEVPVQQNRVLSDDIPAGETIYYRMMCETAGATCTVSIRYHLFS